MLVTPWFVTICIIVNLVCAGLSYKWQKGFRFGFWVNFACFLLNAFRLIVYYTV